MKLSLLWKYYGPIFKKYPYLNSLPYVGMFIAIIATDILTPLAYKNIVDGLEAASPTGTFGVPEVLVGLIVLWVLAFMVEQIGFRLFDFSMVHVQSKMIKDVEDDAFLKLGNHSQNFFANNFSGSLVSKFGRYTSSFETLHDISIFGLFGTIVQLTATISVLFYLYPLLGFIFLFWVIVYIGCTLLFLKKQMKLDVVKAANKSKTTGFIADIITNIINTKMFSSLKFEYENMKSTTYAERKSRDKAWYFGNWVFLYQAVFIQALQIGGLVAAVILWNQGLITLGTVIIVQVYVGRIFMRMWNLGRNMRRTITAFADAKEMIDIFEQTIDIEDPDNPEVLKTKNGLIKFDDVTFGYEDNPPVFDGLHLNIKSGEQVALVGHSGAGKTTITKLLLRFVDIQKGSITIDGQDIRNITQDDLRSVIAYVPQDPILFHRTLRENIAYGKPDATEEEIIQAAKDAHAHTFITSLPDGYDTLVGERGIKLSGGERQRVAIARAMLKDAPILLLDEATSALDSIAEQEIQSAFDRLSKNRTTLVIAHRLSTIVKMDRILVFEHGKIIEQGSHKDLVTQNGTYAELWNSQSHGFIGE